MPLTALGGSTGTVVIGDTTTAVFPQTLHPNVNAYIAAQAGIGYVMTRTEIDAINNLVWSLVGTGIWDKMQVLYPFIGSSLSAMQWNLKNTSSFNITFTGTAFTTSTANGLQKTSTALGSFGNTNYTPSTSASLNNSHISVYLGTVQTSGTSNLIYPIGSFSGSPSRYFHIRSAVLGNNANVGIQTQSASVDWGNTIPNTGYAIASRLNTGGGIYTFFLNGRFVSNSTGTSATTFPTIPAYIGVVNNSGTAAFPCTQAMRFVSIGTGLSELESRNLYIVVQAYQTALGRQV